MRERLLPSQEVLAQRLFRQSQDLADAQRHLQRYHELVVSLQQRMRELGEQRRDDAALRELERFVTQGLARALATESVDYLEVMDGMLKVMSAQVTVRPSGHEFTVEGHATLLQAGLHAGLMLNYGCGNGTCGMCKVRVISGEVARTQPFDYPLSEAEKAPGLHAGLRPHRGEQRADAGDCWRPAARRTSRSSRSSATCGRQRSWRPTRGCCICRRRAATACASWPGSR